jgi:hypothetical protein
MDPARLKLVSGKIHAWVKIDGSQDRTLKWSEAEELYSIDCSEETSKVLTVVTYDSYGKIVSNESVPDYAYSVGYTPIVPDTMAETVEKTVCKAPTPGQ